MAKLANEQEPILASWKVNDVLKRDPRLLETLVGLSPAFQRLRNPLVRKVQSRLVTVEQAARIAGLEPTVVVRALNDALGIVNGGSGGAGAAEGAAALTPSLAAAAKVAVELDARPLLERGEEPFRAILSAAACVPTGQALRLLAPFEPLPLYGVLAKRGYAYWSQQLGPDGWDVRFARVVNVPVDVDAPMDAPAHAPAAAPQAPAADSAAAEGPPPDAVVRIDVSDLEPPQPMVRILETLRGLAPGQTLLVEHVRRPVYLYPHLDQQGYLHTTTELGPGRVEIRITVPAEPGRAS